MAEKLEISQCLKGRDEYGPWKEFSVKGVVQRMRWIEPGSFLMGSPEDEPGSFYNESPQHEVRIKDGFWLFDTPCTQALWQAVMGENPSFFHSPNRPVERVSREDAQRFMQRLNERIAGLDPVLPSEAQWEYACRAGTDTALYTGSNEVLDYNHLPVLDLIAWHSGNSGVGTHPVKRKLPNAWGLYDMLGNVWEWTRDSWYDSYEGAPADGSVRESDTAGTGWVIRGGSWNSYARHCRCALREKGWSYYRIGAFIGFRCAAAAKNEEERAND